MNNYATIAEMFAIIHATRDKLDARLALLTDEEFCRPGLMEEWAVKDILMHLVDWEQKVIGWYEAGLRGEIPSVPGEGYTWATLPALNRLGFESHRGMALPEVRQAYRDSFNQTIDQLGSLPEQELFAHGRYPWTGKWSLADYFACCTHRHYEWALRNIRMSRLRPKQ